MKLRMSAPPIVLIMFYQPDIRFRHLRTAYLEENIATTKQTRKTAEWTSSAGWVVWFLIRKLMTIRITAKPPIIAETVVLSCSFSSFKPSVGKWVAG